MFKKTVLGAVLAAGSLVGLVPTAAHAQQYSIVVQSAPPAPVYEAVPAPRRGYVWSPGHHEWRANQYVWVPGTWYRERPGYAYNNPRWVERNGQWYYEAGNWRRGGRGDRDHDGVANRYDRDVDGDGVPNHRDRFPNNRNRS